MRYEPQAEHAGTYFVSMATLRVVTTRHHNSDHDRIRGDNYQLMQVKSIFNDTQSKL